VVVDSGEKHADAERFYQDRAARLNLDVVWWGGPFNYSAANNLGARASSSEVLIFLNDDTELTQPDWIDELVGWVSQPGVGLAGLQLVGGQGVIQHGGIVLGMNGFADHLFAGMRPGEDSMFGSTRWYRNGLSVNASSFVGATWYSAWTRGSTAVARCAHRLAGFVTSSRRPGARRFR
jgi:O-antigen biosynthesis protein